MEATDHGGQITPPIMGAAAFLMVEYLAVPYQTIIVAAIVPAFMHFFGVFCQIHFEAKKYGLKGLPKSELPVARDVIRRDWPTAMPLAVLLMVLFSDFTPYLAAFWGITGCIVLGLTNRNRVVAVAFVAVIAVAIRLQILTDGSIPIFGARLPCRPVTCERWAARRASRHPRRLRVGAKSDSAARRLPVRHHLACPLTGAASSWRQSSGRAAIFTRCGALRPRASSTPTMTLFFTLVMTAISACARCGIPTTANSSSW